MSMFERSGVLQPVGSRWGLREALIGFVVAFACGALAASIASTVTDGDGVLVAIAGSIGLWIGFIGAPVYASHQHGSGRLRDDFGLRIRWIDVPIGLVAGTLGQLVVVPLVYLPLRLFGPFDVGAPARTLTEAVHRWEVVVLVLVVAVGAPIAEELFFRGLWLGSLQRRWTSTIAVLGTTVVFAGTHFQLLQLIGLFAAGLIFAGLTTATARLGPAIWAHAAFNATTVIVLTVG